MAVKYCKGMRCIISYGDERSNQSLTPCSASSCETSLFVTGGAHSVPLMLSKAIRIADQWTTEEGIGQGECYCKARS